MKKIKFAINMASILLVFFVIYNSIFGWNEIPINYAESICDYIFNHGMLIAFFIYLMPLMDIYEHFVKKQEELDKD